MKQSQDRPASVEDFLSISKFAELSFSEPVSERDKVGQVNELIELTTLLREVSGQTRQQTIAIYTILAGKDNCLSLVITSNKISSVRPTSDSDNLNEKALQLWALLQSDYYDPTKLANELYRVVFAPIEDSVPKDTGTILWSLDGNLRYLPMAALYDGQRYLGERYNHVMLTRVDKERLTRAVSPTWNGYGFGTSIAHRVKIGAQSIPACPEIRRK